MKRSILFLILVSFFSSLTAQYSPYSVSGGNGTPLPAENNSQYRLEVYLLNGLSNARINFTSSKQGTHQWYRYSDYANNATPVSSIQDGNTSYITDVQNGYGYFVGLPTEELPHYVWIIDYSRYVPRFFSLQASEEDDKCEFLKIIADVEAEQLNYYFPTGIMNSLTRNFTLQYSTLEWVEKDKQFVPIEKDMVWKSPISETQIKAPLANTNFTLTGDKFAEHFGMKQSITSAEYHAIAIEAHYTAITTKEHANNEIHQSGNSLGGSAPIEYTFTAYANEPVAAMYIWKITQIDSLGASIEIVRDRNKVRRHNFDKDGFYRVALEISDGSSACMATDSFNVIIESTVIKIPNAFSPGSSIGVNDELKIAFSSLITFKASVYNRWGNLLFQWNDPAKGWDGRVNGKFVPTGVYYVVVEYKDSSGKNRTTSKAVNVLRAKN